jgi:broad specificity phosphatase PhoE
MPAHDSRLILVRHSIPQIDPDCPAHEWLLSMDGLSRLPGLVERLVKWQPASIHASPEPKALQTAEFLARAFDLPMSVRPGLEEHHRRTVVWMERQAFEAAAANLFACPDELVFGEESGEAACARFSAVADEILSAAPPGPPVLATHGTVLSLFAARRCGLDGYNLWKRLTMPCLAVLTCQNGAWRLEALDLLV